MTKGILTIQLKFHYHNLLCLIIDKAIKTLADLCKHYSATVILIPHGRKHNFLIHPYWL